MCFIISELRRLWINVFQGYEQMFAPFRKMLSLLKAQKSWVMFFFCIWNRFLFNALSEMNSGLVFSHNLTHTEIICIPAIIFQAHLSNTFACILGPKSQIFFFLSFFVRNYMVQVLNLEQGPSLPVKWVCQGGWCAALRTSLHRFSEVEIFTLCFWDPLLFPLIFTESFHSSLWINTTALFWYGPFFTLREWLRS